MHLGETKLSKHLGLATAALVFIRPLRGSPDLYKTLSISVRLSPVRCIQTASDQQNNAPAIDMDGSLASHLRREPECDAQLWAEQFMGRTPHIQDKRECDQYKEREF